MLLRTTRPSGGERVLSSRDFPNGSPEQSLLRSLARRGMPLTESFLADAVGRYREQGAEEPAALLENILQGTAANCEAVPQKEVILEAKQSSHAAEVRKKMTRGLAKLVGQANAKSALVEKVVERAEKWDESAIKPASFFFVGPPGVGKTHAVETLAEALTGSAANLIQLDGSAFDNEHSISQLTGSDLGLEGGSNNAQSSRLGPDKVDAVRGPDGTVVIYFNEIAQIHERAKHAVMNVLTQALEKGWLTLKDGTRVDLRKAVWVFDGNPGVTADGSVNLQKALEALQQILPPQIASRKDSTIFFDYLTPEEAVEIARDVKLLPERDAAEKAALPDRRIRIQVDDAIADLIVDLGYRTNPKMGFRRADKLLEAFVYPHFSRILGSAKDGDTWRVELDPNAGDPRRLVNLFQKAADQSEGIPAELASIGFPIRNRFVEGLPRLYPSDSPMPQDPSSPFLPLASGSWQGRGFVVGKMYADDPDDPVRLIRLRANPADGEGADSYELFDLPEELTRGAQALYAAPFDAGHLLFTSVKSVDGKLEQYSCLMDADGAATRIPDPPMPRLGAALAAGEGKAFLWGGRKQVASTGADGRTQFRLDPTNDAFNRDIAPEDTGYFFDGTDWTTVASSDPKLVGSSYAAPVFHDGAFKFIGGGQLETFHSGTWGTKTSSDIVELRLDTGELRLAGSIGPSQARAFATAFVDDDNRIQVLNGVRYKSAGAEREELASRLVLGEDGVQSFDLGRPGFLLAAVPRMPGETLVGPYYDPAFDEFEFMSLRPQRPGDAVE